MNVRIRFKDPERPVRYVRGRDLVPHPQNWRTHAAAQLDALRGVLAEVGFADVVKGFELPDGRIQVIDGHARAEVLPDQEIPVLLLDVNEEEAKKLLVTFDPLGDMAGADDAKLDALLAEVSTDNSAVAELLDDLARQHGLGDGIQLEEPGGTDVIPEKYQILVEFDSESDQAAWLEKLAAEGLKCRSLIS